MKKINHNIKFISPDERISVLEAIICFFVLPFGIIDMFYRSEITHQLNKAEQAFRFTLIGYLALNFDTIMNLIQKYII